MTSVPAVLIVDDEPAIRRLLRTSLVAQGYRTLEAATGGEALSALGASLGEGREPVDVVLLDLGLPDMDGMALLRRLRATSAVPIVVLTSREDERTKVAALDLGADDYVTKPFGMAELMARLRAAVRHRLQQEGAAPVFRSGDLMVDLVRRIITVGGTPVHLSPREYDILALLVKHAGKVLTHRLILGQLWGAGGDVQQLRVYVRQVRQKIEADPEQPRHILTETGVGYRLAVQEQPLDDDHPIPG
jgi:two-component system KDP operon response regulator KdpE